MAVLGVLTGMPCELPLANGTPGFTGYLEGKYDCSYSLEIQ